MKLMSLFDGSGGFPLAGFLHGIKPVYAAEVEPYPIAVSSSHFPRMKHLGSVTEINGAELDPVDIVTFGSPCQDLSVAGAQKGIHDGARSNLFFQAVRIIKELRENDAATGRANEHVLPRFAVWENVPGAYSSNNGHDFQAVLQALAEIADPEVCIPMPEKGKWAKAGCIVGDGWSIAWRTLDAQFWGVPQRRKRIYLVADFGSERAGEILFEREGVSGHFEPSAAKGQGTAEDSQGSVGGSDNVQCLNPWDLQSHRQHTIDGAFATLQSHQGGRFEGIVYPAAFMGGQGADAGSIGYSETVSPTLKATNSGSNQVPDVIMQRCTVGLIDSIGGQAECCWIGEKASTLKATHYKSPLTVAYTSTKPQRKWIVRRLMPMECARLQGFPDDWGHPDKKDDFTEEEYQFWLEVRNTHATINGKAVKQYTKDQMLKWYNKLHTESAEYKMWGNGIALPCAAYVMGRIAEEVRNAT